MRRYYWLFVGAILGTVFFIQGCKGPIGATGPLGPTGLSTASPVFLFNQNFDNPGYDPSSQFTLVEEEGGSESMGLSGSDFVSAPESLSVSSSTGAGPGSGIYTSPGAVPYLSGYDYYLDTYVDFEGIAGTGVKSELVLVLNGSIVASVGYLSSASEIYTYNNYSVINLATYSGSVFQHFVLYWNHSNGLSAVAVNGSILSQNLMGTRPEPSGSPLTCAGVYFPASTSAGYSYVLIDNLSIYHY